MKILTIVPRLPPEIDGIGDHAINLARGFRQQFGIESQFLVADLAWQHHYLNSEFPGDSIPERNTKIFFEMIQRNVQSVDVILVHYVLHSYAKKGCPFWLVEALEKIRKTYPNLKIVTMFHEIYSMGRGLVPWNTDFWLLPWQKELAARMIRCSDAHITSSEIYADKMRRLVGNHLVDILTLPVPTPFLEPSSVASFSDRKKQLIILGQTVNKAHVYRSANQLKTACTVLKIEEIIDIGPTAPNTPDRIGEIPVSQVGKLPSEAVSCYLLNAQAGFLSYDPARLAKSSIFATYAAYGMLPINTQGIQVSVDGLISGQQYWIPDTSRIEDLPRIIDNARAWYLQHDLLQQVKSFARLLLGDAVQTSEGQAV